jgi:hypothetical protein
MNVQQLVSADARPRARRAALAVHGLSAIDRTWLVAQLSGDERLSLEPLLVELSTLALPADGSLVAELLGPMKGEALHTSPAEAVPLATERQHRASEKDELCRLNPAAVLKALHGEAPGLIARLLHVHAWPWRETVLEQLVPAKRRDVTDRLETLRWQPGPQLPEALCNSLANALHHRIVQINAQSSAASAPAVKATKSNASGWVTRMPRWGALVRARNR